MPITFTYQTILDGVTDSCSLTQPVVSTLPEATRPTRQSVGRAGAQNVPPATEATGSGSLPGQTEGVQQIQDLTVSGNAISGNVTIDLTPYQTALQGLNFPQNNDIALSTELSKNKIKPSLDSLLGINAFGSSSYLGSVNGSVLINSDRVIVNAKERLAMMCGKKGVAIAAPTRVNIDAGESITLAAYGADKDGALFIGLPNTGLSYEIKNQKQIGVTKGHPTPDQAYEPLVLGIKLANILEDFLYILKSAEAVDAFSPVKFQPTVQAELALLANRIPEILSNYAYIDGMSHSSVDMKQLETIKAAQAQTPDYIPPKNLTGSFEGQFTVTTSTGGEFGGPGGNFGGPGLAPLKNYIVEGESSGDYNVYNYGPSGGSGIKSATPGSPYYKAGAFKATSVTANAVRAAQSSQGIWAIGKYQTIPVTLQSAINALGIGDSIMNEETQEKIGDYLIFSARARLSAYVQGKNAGTIEDLENAVQDLGQEFASKPVIFLSNRTKVGDVVTGNGNKAYYGGKGPNPSVVSHKVGDSVQVIVKSRIQHSGKQPSFMPSYYRP